MYNKYYINILIFMVMAFIPAQLYATDYDELLVYYEGLYSRETLDSPARYALNEIALDSWRSLNLLRGKLAGLDDERKDAAKKLTELKKRIELGLHWPYKTPPSFEIPYAKSTPKIDGKIDESCWNEALVFNGYYPINSVDKVNDDSVWKIMWDKKFIYVSVFFPDKNVLSSDLQGHPYRGDSLEIFMMPSMRMKKYWEVVIGCDGDSLEGFHCNNRYGDWTSEPTAKMEGLKFKALKQKHGYSIEIAIPFSELPNYMLGNQPNAGEILYFVLVRTDIERKNEKSKFYSPFPFLYSGHNVFGYAKGILCVNLR